MEHILFIDTHCHAINAIQDMRGKSFPQDVDLCVLMSTKPTDWPIVEKLHGEFSKCIPAFGLHPWYIQTHHTGMEMDIELHELKKFLERNKSSILGEIGLDGSAKIIKDPKALMDDSPQMIYFKELWKLSWELKRPVSLHLVSSDDVFFDFLKDCEKFPPAVAIHSYTGSKTSLKRLLSIKETRFYFSVSKSITGKLPEKKLQRLISTIPEDRILIESDRETLDLMVDDLQWSMSVIASVKSWTAQETMLRLKNNSCAFLHLSFELIKS